MKFRRRWPVSLALILLVHSPQVVAGDRADEIVSKLQETYGSLRDATVTFTQRVLFGVTQSQQEFSGTLLLKKGNKYRIELEDQTIVTDGRSVWRYSKLDNQVFIDKYAENPNSFSPDKALVNVPDTYSPTLVGNERLGSLETSVLKLVPKSDRSDIKWMKVWVDCDRWLMKRVQVLDVSDNLTTYDIGDVRLNAGIPDSVFSFTILPGTEVIDAR